MSRTAARIDVNQPAIVESLRGVGATVQSLAGVGKGCPDLLVGFRGANLLMEVKNGEAVPSEKKLTPDQAEWHMHWFGTVHVVEDVAGALALLKGVAVRERK